jgi:hypothetical protein
MNMHPCGVSAIALSDLGEPTWGERLLLARRRAGVNLAEAAHRVSQAVPVSYGTINRLEAMTSPPLNRKQRMYAILLLLAYSFDPADFGLSVEELPAALNTPAVQEMIAAARIT